MSVDKGKGRRQFLLLVALFLGPVVLAVLLYFGGLDLRPRGSVAHGELISPVVELPVIEDVATFRGAWTLVVLGDGECDQSCAEALVKIRQIRLSLGREMERIERILVIDDNWPGLEQLMTGHPGLQIVNAGEPQVARVMASFPGPASQSLYLVDPLGNLMMRFDRSAQPKAIRKDLKRLLRLSSIG